MSGGDRRFIHVNRIDTMAGGADDIMARQAFEVCGLPGGAHGTYGRVRDFSVKQRFAFQYVRIVCENGSCVSVVHCLSLGACYGRTFRVADAGGNRPFPARPALLFSRSSSVVRPAGAGVVVAGERVVCGVRKFPQSAHGAVRVLDKRRICSVVRGKTV